MVSKRGTPYRFPATPESIGRLVESSLMLWLASWRQTFWPALLYGVAGLLPLFTLGDLGSRVLQSSAGLLLTAAMPWLPLPVADDPMELLAATLAWLLAPSTWVLVLASLLLALVSITLVIHRMHAIGAGEAGSAKGSWRIALSRVPSALGAWLVYGAILGLCTLPLAAGMVFVYRLGTDAELPTLMMLLCAYLLGCVVLSVPLVWSSVAAGFAPFASTIEGDGPLAAQRRSVARVRGHWTHSALVFAVPLLVYLGVGGTLSSILMVMCAAIAFSQGGWVALIGGDWMGWSQLLAMVPMAIAFPLSLAGGVVCWHDLELRMAARRAGSDGG
jgi:hypothetical protein